MTDYAELLATKSAELAELTRAFNHKDYAEAYVICSKLSVDFEALEHIARQGIIDGL